LPNKLYIKKTAWEFRRTFYLNSSTFPQMR